MANKNICDVDLLQSMSKNTNVIVDENGKVNKLNLHNEFNTINTKIDNEVNTLSNNIAQLSNPNLLINSDFRNPINQRGETTYSGSGNPYSIDRWRTLSSNVEIIEGGLRIYNTISTRSYFAQFFEKPYKGTYTLTLNVLTLDGACVIYGDGFNEQQLVEGINVYHVTTNSNYNLINIVLGLHSGSSIVIEYIKLEQGSIATPFVPRPYGEELALCQRYYQKFGPVRLSLQAHTNGKLFFRLPFECEMKVTPSVSMDSSSTCALYKRDGWTRVVMFSLANVTFDTSTTYVDIMCTYSSSFVDATLDLIGGYIHADAEIY